jgi:hypothetical protein
MQRLIERLNILKDNGLYLANFYEKFHLSEGRPYHNSNDFETNDITLG